jgi:hypothetical protein
MSSAAVVAAGVCLVLAGVLLAQSTTAASEETPAVWAIGEGFRVDPLTGRVREEQRIDGNPLPKELDYHQHNFVWEAAGPRISLVAARNEVVAYQLQIRGPASNVRVTCSDLRGPGVIRADQDIEVFKQWYVNVTENSSNQDSTTAGYNLGRGWYADALIPVDSGGGYGQPFDIPDRLNNVGGQRWQGIWVDIYVPAAAAGWYGGAVTVTADGSSRVLPVQLHVFDVTLSDDFACEVGLNNYGGIGRKGSAARLRYHQMAHRHRMAIHEHYIQAGVTGQGEQMRAVWEEYDGELEKYFSGQAFTERHGYRGPGQGRPVRWFYLPFEIVGSHAWPMPKAAMRTAEYDGAVRAALRDFVEHFRRRGWTGTNVMFFINGLDEPKTVEAIEDIRYFGELAASAEAKNVYYRADVNHMHDIGTSIPGWTEQTMLEKLGSVVELWCCVADFARTDFSVLAARREAPRHDVVWFYQNREPSVGGYCLDDETIGLRTWPVIAWKYGLDGCILWECTYAGQSQDIWVDPRNSVSENRVHNMAGFLLYPGRSGVTEPVGSIRLKSFRRGAQDYEYLRIVESRVGREAAGRILQPVLRHALHRPGRPYGAAGDWSHNPEDWERMRQALLEAIVVGRGTSQGS